MKFLISTKPQDLYTILVKHSLEAMGHKVSLFCASDLPSKQKNSMLIHDTEQTWKSMDKHDTFFDNEYDVVWWRSKAHPCLAKNKVHPEDYSFVMQENDLFLNEIINNVAPNAWWVNSKDAAMRAHSKLYSLKMARNCGLNIPITLFSNDPKEIRQFLLQHEDEGVMYKPFASTCWFEETAVNIAASSKITFLELPNNHLLQIAPGMYQKEQKIKYKLKILCFGEYKVAIKLSLDENQKSIELYPLPRFLENNLKDFMAKMGLVFGCFDFIMNTDNQYIFLDLNEQGDFLWIEQWYPKIMILDIFVQFLVGKTIKFFWDPKKVQHKVADYLQ